MRVSESWGEDPRRRSWESSGAGRLLGEVCEEVFQAGVGGSVKTVLMGVSEEWEVVLSRLD